jgi:integrase
MPGMRPFTIPELNTIKALPESRTKLLLICGIYTGFRISELLSLKVAHLFLDGRIKSHITIQKEFMKGKKKSRTVPIHPLIAHMVSTYVTETHNPNAPIFLSRKGHNKPISSRQGSL